MAEKQTPPPRRTLEIMPCNRGQVIFLILQYLLPQGHWRWNPFSLVSSAPINLQQWIIKIHIHIWLHFMNWWEQWVFNQVILKLFICASFHFIFFAGKAKEWLKSHPNQRFFKSLATSKQSLYVQTRSWWSFLWVMREIQNDAQKMPKSWVWRYCSTEHIS